MSSVNAAITDAIVQPNVITIGMMPAAAMGMTYVAGAHAIGMVMHNAATTQHNMQAVAATATAITCAMIVSKGGSGG